MKKVYLIGNHKMNINRPQLEGYLKELSKASKRCKHYVGLTVSSPYLYLAKKYLTKSNVFYGAQNCHYADKGNFTGEQSVIMIKDFGCKVCIVGHSERRMYDNETNEKTNLKIKTLLKNSLRPIFCFGETKEEREAGLTKKVVKIQLEEGLKDIVRDEVKKIFFAYEPVWAISPNLPATAKQVEEMAKFVKEYLCKMYDLTEGEIILLYGGSLNPNNGVESLTKTHVDGGLIGSASLDIEEFKKLINLEIEE